MKSRFLTGIIFFLLFLIISSPIFAEISFTVSNPQQSGEETTVDVFLSGLTSSSCNEGTCYLQAAFTAQDNPKYFGFTKNHLGQWYEYDGSPELAYLQSNFFAFQPTEGNWSGQLSIKPNTNDPDYLGPGKYNIKAWRYSGKSTSYSGYSNVLEIDLVGPTLSPTSTPSPTPSPSNSPSPIKTPTPTKSPTPKKSPTPTKSPSPTNMPSSAKATALISGSKTIAIETGVSKVPSAAQSPSPTTVAVLGSSSENNLPKILIGIGSVFLLACGILTFWKFKIKNEKRNYQQEP